MKPDLTMENLDVKPESVNEISMMVLRRPSMGIDSEGNTLIVVAYDNLPVASCELCFIVDGKMLQVVNFVITDAPMGGVCKNTLLVKMRMFAQDKNVEYISVSIIRDEAAGWGVKGNYVKSKHRALFEQHGFVLFQRGTAVGEYRMPIRNVAVGQYGRDPFMGFNETLVGILMNNMKRPVIAELGATQDVIDAVRKHNKGFEGMGSHVCDVWPSKHSSRSSITQDSLDSFIFRYGRAVIAWAGVKNEDAAIHFDVMEMDSGYIKIDGGDDGLNGVLIIPSYCDSLGEAWRVYIHAVKRFGLALVMDVAKHYHQDDTREEITSRYILEELNPRDIARITWISWHFHTYGADDSRRSADHAIDALRFAFQPKYRFDRHRPPTYDEPVNGDHWLFDRPMSLPDKGSPTLPFGMRFEVDDLNLGYDMLIEEPSEMTDEQWAYLHSRIHPSDTTKE